MVATVLLWIGAWVVLLGVLGGALVMLAGDECKDSATGQHEDITTRTSTGTCRQCIWCGRMTSGIDAFKRQA